MINKQRKAFSLIMAIVVIVLMSTVAALIMNMSGKMIKKTTIQYQKEQALLLAKSYTEFAVMSVMANDRNNTYTTGNDCLEDIDATVGTYPYGYRVRTRISYIGNNQFGQCATTRVLSNSVVTPNSPLNIIVDVYVEYLEADHPDTPKYISYHRRTLQKI